MSLESDIAVLEETKQNLRNLGIDTSKIDADIDRLRSQLVQAAGMGKLVQGPDGYVSVSGGVNQYGRKRPDYLTARDLQGNLADRFKNQMGTSWTALQEKALAEGDTAAAKLQRQQVKDAYATNMGNLAQQQAAQLASARGGMGMRGGIDTGARERLFDANQRQGIMARQGLGRNLADQNLGISMQDEAMKNQLLQQTGNVEQALAAANVDRLFRDINYQNAFMQKNYGEDMAAWAGIKSAEASAPKDEGCVIATHAISTGAFTEFDRKRAVKWCMKNLHGNFIGETFRKGYRHIGRKVIKKNGDKDMSKYYQEFNDWVDFASGKNRTLKGFIKFSYRAIQMFVVGLFITEGDK